MPVEIKGQQLRIRVRSPTGASQFRTQDVGDPGRLQRVAGLYKDGWHTQSWRLNLKNYSGNADVTMDLDSIPERFHYDRARKLVRAYFGNGRGWHGEPERHSQAAKGGLYSRVTRKQWRRALKSSKTADWYLDEARRK